MPIATEDGVSAPTRLDSTDNATGNHASRTWPICRASTRPPTQRSRLWNFEKSELFKDAERCAIRLALKADAQPNEASQEDFDALKTHCG